MADSVIQGVIGKIVDYSVDALKKQVNYLCCYSCNVQTLADELGELNIRHESIQQDVDAARANFGVITPEVEAWLRKVEELKSRSSEIRGDAEEIQRSSVCKWLPLLHYSLSRKAFKAAKDSVELRNTKLDKIFNPIILAEIAPVPTTSNVGFESRYFIENRIMDALKDPNVYSIGIWGIGGVGKTVMAKRIEEKVREEMSLFEHVIMVVVSQNPDLPMLQNQIAEGLNLTLSEESPVFRQRKLHRRLIAEKSILIILDDLWERLDLEEFGIPSQASHACCKLILTSRNRDALTSTGVLVQNIFPLETLTEEESWRFFIDNVGKDLDDDDSHNELVQIAKKVEGECKGLPLALKIVASALKDKDVSFWDNAVRELEKSVPDNIPGVLKGVYGPLLYSINALEGKEQKDLFLLCCLFPEDYSISIEELLRCAIGLRIFKGLDNLMVVRDKVKTMLKILLSRSLLIEDSELGDYLEVRMHDVIRDVGIWITTEEGMVRSNKEKHLWMVSHGLHEWPSMMEEDYTCISLLFSDRSITFRKSIVCTKLELLRLQFVNNVYGVNYIELPENFFNGIGGLKVLEAFSIGLLPPSIGQLKNLRTLFLRRCNILETVSVLGKLINLEILNLEGCKFEMLPVEIGGLKTLKQMNILNCKSLRRIAFGVISGLARLEELVILGSFDSWEAKDEGENDVACLSELNGLKNLTTLKIEIKNPSVVPKQKPLWVQKVKKYSISISNCGSDFGKQYFQKAILLGIDVVNPLGDWLLDMASEVEYLHLEGSNCMNVLNGLSKNSRNLSCLKKLRLSQFNNIRYLVEGLQKGAFFPMLEGLYITDSVSLQQISDVSPPIGSFKALQKISLSKLSELICLWKVSIKEQFYLKNLQSIEITECDNLSYMFSLSVVQSLVQLSSLNISFCETMKEIFKRDDGESVKINKIVLPNLRHLYFKNLKSFYHFCNEIDRIELPKLVGLSLCDLPSMKITKGDNKEEVDQWYFISKVAGMNFNFCGLTYLVVKGFENFKCMFSPSVICGVPNLRTLEVENCSMLEQVIGKHDEIVGETILFRNLVVLSLAHLPNILTFCYNAIQMPSLECLTISHCPLMLRFVEELSNHISNSTPFLNNQVQCPKLKELTGNQLNISIVFSPRLCKSVTKLQNLYLINCEELEHVITREGQSNTVNMEEEFIQRIPLERLTLIKLPKLHGSVFQMKQHLEFPSLEIIRIEDCPMLEKFSLGYVHLPKLISVSGMLNNECAANFFFHSEMSSAKTHSDNNCFIIFVKDISFNFDLADDNRLYFLTPGSSDGSFVDAISFPLNDEARKIVGKFKTEKIMTGIVYEIILMIMVDQYNWEDPIEIELKLFGESELQQRTKFLENQPMKTWTEISIGKFTREPQQINEEFEFSLHQPESLGLDTVRRLSIKGVRFLEV